MAQKTKTRQITIVGDRGAFTAFFRKFSGEKKEYDFESLAALRNLLSNEKARLIHTVREKKPKSVYDLAKILGRNFKSVIEDVRLLERFGFLELILEKTGQRNRLKPVVVVDSINIELKI